MSNGFTEEIKSRKALFPLEDKELYGDAVYADLIRVNDRIIMILERISNEPDLMNDLDEVGFLLNRVQGYTIEINTIIDRWERGGSFTKFKNFPNSK